MQEAQAVSEINNTIQQAIAGGFQAVAAIQALTMLLAVGAVLLVIWRQSKSQAANAQNQKFLIETFSGVSTQQNERIIQQGNQMTDVVESNTQAMNRNSDTREANTVAINNWTNAQTQMVEALRVLTADINSRQGLTEGSVSTMNDTVKALTLEFRAQNIIMDRLTKAVEGLPSEQAQNAALIRGMIAEWGEIRELIMNTLRPPQSASTPAELKTTTTPETSQ